MSYVTLLEDDSRKLVSGFLQILPLTFNYALHPFTIINPICDNDYILGTVSPLISYKEKLILPSFKGNYAGIRTFQM